MQAVHAERQYFVDWLRIAAFGLLVLYHVGMVYVPWDWHIKSRQTYASLEPFMRLSNPWRMGLLFLLSGAATACMLRSRPQGLLQRRAARLLLPLVTGMVLIVPPQAWMEVRHHLGYVGSYLDFLALYFTGYRGFCRGTDCLVLPTWNHLWFLPYLFVYTAGLVVAWRTVPAGWRHAAADRLAALPAWALWLLPIVPLALARWLLFPRFPGTHALVNDAYNHAVYGFVFMLGAGLGARPALWARLAGLRWPALIVALGCWWGIGVALDILRNGAAEPAGARALQRAAYAVLQWSALVAVVGFGQRHLNRDHRWRAPLNEAVFPVYLLHQTVIVLGVAALAPRALPAGAEALLLLVGTFVLSLAGWQLLRRTGRWRPWFGLPKQGPVGR